MSSSPAISRVTRRVYQKLGSQFLGALTHELCTPLNQMIGLAEMLCAQARDAELRESLERMRVNGHALRRLLGDTFDYLHLCSGVATTHCEENDLWDALENVLRASRAEAEEKGVSLALRLDDAARPPFLLFDRNRLSQVVSILVERAIRRSPGGSVVLAVSIQPCEEGRMRVSIEVRDTGAGISAVERARIFEPFGADAGGAGEGDGLCLALCHELARAMGGELRLSDSSSRENFVRFAADFQQAGEAPQLPPRVPERPTAPARVLVVDDHQLNRTLACRLLRLELGIRADEAGDGRQCLEMHLLNPYDLILMDIHMPLLNGFEATRLIREAEGEGRVAKRARIVALTAHAVQGSRALFIEQGMDDCFSKPLRVRDLRPHLPEVSLAASH